MHDDQLVPVAPGDRGLVVPLAKVQVPAASIETTPGRRRRKLIWRRKKDRSHRNSASRIEDEEGYFDYYNDGDADEEVVEWEGDGEEAPSPPSSPEASSIMLKDYFNNQYVGQLGVGTPAQTLSVVFDTGSSDIWLPGRGCTQCGNHRVFDFTQSSTYQPVLLNDDTAKPFEVDYGSGKVVGYQGIETLTIGTLQVKTVQFGEVMFEDQEIQSFMMDGIVGLAFSGLAIVTRPTLLELFREQNKDVPAHFSVFLSNDPSDTKKPSRLTFGGYDLSLVSPNATWQFTPVVRFGYGEETYWSVKMQSLRVIDKDDSSITLVDVCLGGCKVSGWW